MQPSIKFQAMISNYNLTQRLLSCTLLLSFFLQSCRNPDDQFNVITHESKGDSARLNIQHLVNEEFGLEKDCVVAFNEDDGTLQADVKLDPSQPPTYKGLSVIIEQGTNLAELPYLSSQTQRQRIQFRASHNQQPSCVVILKGGILGGMMEGDNYQEKEKKKEKLDAVIPQELLEEAENGYGKAQYEVGKIYYDIWKREQSTETLQQAKEWLTKAVERNNAAAESLLKILKREIAFKTNYLNHALPIILKGEIEYGDLLGNGGMGTVYKAQYQGVTVAAKKLKRLSEEELDNFYSEAMLMANHRHKNIITFIGRCIEENALAMEYMPGGSLWDLLNKHQEDQNWDTSWKLRTQIALDVAEGMCYLHDCSVLHRDLKSENVLLDSDGQAKLTDLGISVLKSENSTYGVGAGGTFRWMAPEIFKTDKNTKESDVYSYGMILWELGARRLPFKDYENGFSLISYIQAGNHEIISGDTPAEVRKIIELCWLPEQPPFVRQRPSMRRVRHLLEQVHPDFIDEEKEELKRQLINLLERIIKTWPQGPRVLTRLKNLEAKLDLTTCQLTDNEIDFLINHPCFFQIHTLDLHNNEIGAEGASKLAEVLPITQIHTLNLEDNKIGAEGAIKLAEVLPSTQIHTLNLERNKIGAEGASKLAEALPNSQLHTLNLSTNQIGAERTTKLADALAKSQIHTLYLNNNKIGAEGASKLAEALPNSQIHTLFLNRNEMGDSGASKLAETLPNSQIRMLDLNMNLIGAEGAIKLAEALPKSQVHSLNISYNQINNSGAIKLAEALPKSQVHTLGLRANQISAEMQRLLQEQNPGIKFLF